MNTDQPMTTATLIPNPDYAGRGTRGYSVPGTSQGRSDGLVELDAGAVFGGDISEQHEWSILEGEGQLSWSDPFRESRAVAGDRFRMEAGDWPLLRATTPMRLRLRHGSQEAECLTPQAEGAVLVGVLPSPVAAPILGR